MSGEEEWEEELSLLERSAQTVVRNAPRSWDELTAELEAWQRERLYRSPTVSASTLAGRLRNHPYARMTQQLRSVLMVVVREHEHWRARLGDVAPPVFVHLPSRALRERVLQITSGPHHFVEIGDGLLLFLVKLARILAIAWEESAVAGPEELLAMAPLETARGNRSRTYFLELLSAITVGGHSGATPQVDLGPEREAFASNLVTAMALFVASRAFALELGRSLRSADSEPRVIGDFKADELVVSTEVQIEADYVACDLMARACQLQRIPTGIVMMAPALYLQGALAVERAMLELTAEESTAEEPIAGDPSAGSEALPPHAAERAKVFTTGAEGEADIPAAIAKKARWLEGLFDALWDGCRDYFKRCRELGVAPGLGGRRHAAHWLTPLAADHSGADARPFFRLEDRQRAAAVAEHLSEVEALRPYSEMHDQDVIVLYRSSLYYETACRLSERFRREGIRAVHDELFVKAEEDWQPQVREMLAGSRLAVMLLSLADLGAGFREALEPGQDGDLADFPVMKELGWISEQGARLYLVGVSALDVHGQAGALFRSALDVTRSVAAKHWSEEPFPVLMVQSEEGSLPEALDDVLIQDVIQTLAQWA